MTDFEWQGGCSNDCGIAEWIDNFTPLEGRLEFACLLFGKDCCSLWIDGVLAPIGSTLYYEDGRIKLR